MQILTRSSRLVRNDISYIPVDDIYPNPSQPRKKFSQDALSELSRSIAQYGVLNPLTVRKRSGRFELVAGERRLRAAKQAGLFEVPCIIMDLSMEESSLLALVENIQRKDLDFVEEAEAISRLIKVFGMSQDEAARRLGKSQSSIANKLRILKLPPDILDTLRDASLSERHGRALLKLPTEDEQREALKVIIQEGLNVASTEEYIERLLSLPPEDTEEKHQRKTLFILKDVRIFMNTLSRGLDLMRQGGIGAKMAKEETDSELILTINIPKQK